MEILAGPTEFKPSRLSQDDLDGSGSATLLLYLHPYDRPARDGGPFLCFIRLGDRPVNLGLIPCLQPRDGDAFLIGADSSLSVIAEDPTWYAWHCHMANSPRKVLRLEYVHERLQLSAQRMYSELPPPAILEMQATNIRKRFLEHKPNDMFWEPVIDLIYSGHPKAGVDMLRKACRDADGSEDPFVEEFINRLHSSHYWPAIACAFGDENSIDHAPPSEDPVIKFLPVKR